MYIVFDIGGTNTRVGISEEGRTIARTVIYETPVSFERGIAMLKKAIASLTGERSVTAIAGGIAAVLDMRRSELVAAPNLPEWTHKPLRAWLQDALSAPVFIENDAALEGLGEAINGAGKGDAIVAYLTIGTGIGGTRIVHGDIDLNVSGFEPGHQIILAETHAHGVETHDLESLVSGRALIGRYGAKIFTDVTHPAWKEAARVLAYGIYNTVLYWSPTSVILGGGVCKSIPCASIKEQISLLPQIFSPMPDVRYAVLGDISGLYGALAILREKCDL